VGLSSAHPCRPRFLLILLAAAFALTGQSVSQSNLAAPALDPRDLFDRVSPSIYVVEGFDAHGDVISIASAVSVDKNEVVTNKHAINAGGSLRVRRAEKSWSAAVDKLDETADLAILLVDGLHASEPPEMRVADNLKVGERVFAIGAPDGLELSLSDGLIAALRHENGVLLVQTTAPISKGSSGGGLFDAEGRLVGITTFYLSGSQNLNFAVAAYRIPALRRQPAESTARAWAAVAAEIADNAYSVAGIEPEPPFSGSDPGHFNAWVGQFNNWSERMQPRLKVVAREQARAARAYSESIRLNPSDAAVWMKLGSLYACLGEPEKTKVAFDQALHLRPNDISILISAGESYDHLGNHGQAVQVFRDAVHLQPANADVWISLANVLERTDHKEAIEALHRAEELKPSSAGTWTLIGMHYRSLKQYANAEAAYQEAVRLEPNRFNLFFLGNFYALERRDKHKFRKVCQRLREIDPDTADKLKRSWR
jgi:cytochrome c-type biogenesis protein CcmH/NrfG